MGCSYSKSKPSEETTHADAPEEAPEPVAQNQSGFETCATTDVVVNLPISDEDPEFVKAKLRGRQGQTPLHLASKTADLKQVAHLLAVIVALDRFVISEYIRRRLLPTYSHI